jgi:hypothetical protein
MTGPFILKATARIHADKAEAYAPMVEVYGPPNDALMEWLQRATEGIKLTLDPVHWGGFTRLQGG